MLIGVTTKASELGHVEVRRDAAEEVGRWIGRFITVRILLHHECSLSSDPSKMYCGCTMLDKPFEETHGYLELPEGEGERLKAYMHNHPEWLEYLDGTRELKDVEKS